MIVPNWTALSNKTTINCSPDETVKKEFAKELYNRPRCQTVAWHRQEASFTIFGKIYPFVQTMYGVGDRVDTSFKKASASLDYAAFLHRFTINLRVTVNSEHYFTKTSVSNQEIREYNVMPVRVSSEWLFQFEITVQRT